MSDGVDMPIRQAAAVYLKNNIIVYWADRPATSGTEMEFSIHENDRTLIRDSIIDATVMAPPLITVNLAVCIGHIIKHDFPGKWFGLVEKISFFLSQPDNRYWLGALLALYQLVKVFEYKGTEERAPMDEAMKVLMPQIFIRCKELLADNSDHSICLQKQIMKIFYAFTQYSLPLKVITNDIFIQWMKEIFWVILSRPKDRNFDNEKEEENWWKCKKWVLHTLSRIFERFGSPGLVSKEYEPFARFYIMNFSDPVIKLLLSILEQQANKQFVDSRVLQLTLVYLTTCVNHAPTWKIIKPDAMPIVQRVLFPLMCYSDEDDELWTSDPHEYIRMKFDIFEDYVSPITAAQNLLHVLSQKRKGMLPKILSFVVEILNNRQNSNPRMIDGALHTVGAVADILLKKEMYKDQIEDLLVAHVFPYFQSQFGYLRARACWVLNYFSATKFQRDSNLVCAVQSVERCLMQERELPVRVQAAICVQGLLTSQEKAQKLLEPNISQITFEIIKILSETGNEELTSAMQKLVCLYSEQLMPDAVRITRELATYFFQILESNADEDNEDKGMTTMGVLNTIDTIMTVMEDQADIIAQLTPMVVQIVSKIFQDELMELYEETLSLVSTITTNSIPTELWSIYELMYAAFKKDCFEYFGDMMPALHNFITVDPLTFLKNQNYVLAMYDICQTVFLNELEEESESYAAKLLECMILQFTDCRLQYERQVHDNPNQQLSTPPNFDEFLRHFVELVIQRLGRKVERSSLQTMLLQVIIAAFYCNPDLLLDILHNGRPANDSLFIQFVRKWLSDIDCFKGLHDRKMSVLGLIRMISLPPDSKKNIASLINDIAPELLPSILKLFEGLKLAYEYKANAENAEDDDSDEELGDESDTEELDDEEDQPARCDYSKVLDKVMTSSPFPVTSAYFKEKEEISEDEESFSDDEGSEFNQTALETYTTPLDSEDTETDEYIIFKDQIEILRRDEPNWFNVLVSPLNQDQHQTLQSVLILASQRKAAAGKFKF